MNNYATVKDYFQLLKPRVMTLVVFTGLIGLIIAPAEVSFIEGLIAIFCIALGSGASGAVNQWYEADIDAKMQRTKNRPIPAGRVSKGEALDFAIIAAGFSVFFMAFAVNLLSAFLLLCAICFYVFIYTIWLKPRTPQNIVIGGAAGAFPPLIGWAAVTGSITYEPVILFALIFFWTPPHFWALSLYASDDYTKAGIPMLPVVKGDGHTKKQIVIYSYIMSAVALLPAIFLGYIYLGVSVILSAYFIYLAYKVKSGEIKDAKRLFYYSMLYLFGLFLVIGVLGVL